MKILIADDSPVALKLLEMCLTRLGRQVITATTGEEAWEAYLKESPPVVISDWMMPDLDGPDFCRRLRASTKDERRYTYVILLTAMEGKRHLVEGLDAGADDFITKPFDPDELAARLRVAERIVGLQRRVRQYESLLPLCMYCKKIRTKNEDWMAVDEYFAHVTDTTVSHGVCPECLSRELDKLRQMRK